MNRKKDPFHITKPETYKAKPVAEIEEGNDANLNIQNNVTDSVSANNVNNASEETEIFRSNGYTKDSIPLLIIDVNIRPGVKKKIYVFDGDTAEGLAEKFSEEHGKRL